MSSQQNPTLFDSLILRVAAFRVAVLFVFHAFVFTVCYAFAWLVRFEFEIRPEFAETLKWSMPVVVGVQLVTGLVFGFYRGWWRYVGIADVVRLVMGVTTALAVLVGGWYLGGFFGAQPQYVRSPRGVLLIDWAFALLALFGTRVLIRLGRDRFRPMETPSAVKRVLIVGAGDAGETLAREIEHRPQLGMKVVGFVDDQRAKWGSFIRGIRVSGPISDIGKIADSARADEALLAIPNASGKRMREIIHHLSAADLKFKTIPSLDHLVSGKVHVSQLRPVNVEDLLRRKRIELPGDPVRKLFRNKRVVVTGAGGTIGSELASQVLQFEPKRLVLVERSEYLLYEIHKRLSREAAWAMPAVICRLVDIQNEQIVRELVETESPDIVLHAAAHKHVPLGEEHPAEYLRNNALATRTLGEIAAEAGVQRFVLISTDKAINPTSVMGATKRAAEIMLLDLARSTSMTVTAVRFGNVIGSSGSVIPLFMEQIQHGGPVTVTHPDMTRYFIRTSEAISLVLQAACLGHAGQIFMLDMGEPVKIVDLARDVIRLSNHSEDEIPIVFTGLRPGEKLEEDLVLTGESVRPTIHPQIVITAPPQPPSSQVATWYAALQTNMNQQSSQSIRRALKQLIPEYVLPLEASGDAEGGLPRVVAQNAVVSPAV